MKALLFDSGPIISITMNHLLDLLKDLKDKFGGNFYVTRGVKRELIDYPIKRKKFEWEALQVMNLIDRGVINLWKEKIRGVNELLDLANSCFSVKGKDLEIIQEAEVEILALAKELNCGVVIDERTIRLLIENPKGLEKILEIRFHEDVKMNKKNIDEFRKKIGEIKIIRSAELMGVAYKIGLLDNHVPEIKDGKDVLLDAILWGMKTEGSSITGGEIAELKKILLK